MSRYRIFIFIGILSFFLYIANLVVYEAVALTFAITSVRQLLALGAALGVLSASFIAATMLGSRYYNIFTRLYYTACAVWMGFLVYFFLASVVFGILVLFGAGAGAGEALLIAAVLVGICGLLHARKIYTREVEVVLPDLPPAWRGRKAIWISDLHLGQLHGPSFTKKVVEKINTLPHDIVFIGGDLFDGTGAPDIPELIAPLRQLGAPLGTYFVTGNHEEFGDSGKFVSAIRSAGIRVLIDEMVDIDGMQIIGVDYAHASNAEQFKRILQTLGIDRTKPSVLLKHEPKDLDIAREAGISLQLSGHTHQAQLWPLEYIARAIYKGFSYGLKDFKEMRVYVSSGVGTWGPPMRVGTNCEIVIFTFFHRSA